MTDLLLANETVIRLVFFIGILAIMAACELVAPRRALTRPKWLRWYANLGIVALNTVVLRLVFPVAAVGVAAYVQDHGWGLLGFLGLIGYWTNAILIVASVIVLDLAIYLQHVMVHAVPVLWRLHRMHHADQDFDVTTGARFHPVEIVLSMGIKIAVIAALGPAPAAVMIFEVLLNATAMFNHSNVKLPLGLDAVLRLLVVTPDMHRVHHSEIPQETNSNFGFNLPWWDRLFGTYQAQPELGHEGMVIGIDLFREERDQHLIPMLVQPMREDLGDYAINRREWSKDQ